MDYVAFDCQRRYTFVNIKDASERASGREGFLPGEIFLDFLEGFKPGTLWALET